jgi:hypothetical protein
LKGVIVSRLLSIVGLFLFGNPIGAGDSWQLYEKVAWIQDEKLIVVETQTQLFLFPVTLFAPKPGTQEKVPITLHRNWEVSKKHVLEQTEISVYGIDGKPIDERTYIQLLMEVQPVWLSENHLIDEKERKTLPTGTLIIVRKTK